MGKLCQPGGIRRGDHRTLADAGVGVPTKEAILAQIPLKRAGSTKDIAEAAAFLASDKASYITGQVISVDGGMAI